MRVGKAARRLLSDLLLLLLRLAQAQNGNWPSQSPRKRLTKSLKNGKRGRRTHANQMPTHEVARRKVLPTKFKQSS